VRPSTLDNIVIAARCWNSLMSNITTASSLSSIHGAIFCSTSELAHSWKKKNSEVAENLRFLDPSDLTVQRQLCFYWFYPRDTVLWPVSVCLSVRHKPVFYRNGWTDWAGFPLIGYPPLILRCILRELWYLQNKGTWVLSSGTLSETLNLASVFFLPYARRMSQVLPTLVRPMVVASLRHWASTFAYNTMGRDADRRAGSSATAESLHGIWLDRPQCGRYVIRLCVPSGRTCMRESTLAELGAQPW